MANTPWCGTGDDKLYLTSGQFTSTIKDSQTIADLNLQGISYDGTNSPWCGASGDKLYLTSGQFTSTIKTSQNINSIDSYPSDISWDGVDTPWSGFAGIKLYLTSGQFTSTIKTSQSTNAIDTGPSGISWDGTNTPWCGSIDKKLYLTSGQFTSTIKTSQYVGDVENTAMSVTWDGTNTPWCGSVAMKLYLTSGQFTSTIKTSQDVSSVDTIPTGIETNDVDARLGIDFNPSYWTIIVKNNDATADVEIEDLSVIIAADSTSVLTGQFAYDEICGSEDLKTAVNNLSLKVSDGDTELDETNGVKFLALQNVYDLESNYYNSTTVDDYLALKIGGTSGSVDNAIIRANGTGGITIQSSTNACIDDNGQMSLGATSAGAMLDIYTRATATIGLIIEARTSQTADLINVNSNAATGGDYFSINATGNIDKMKADPSSLNDSTNFILGGGGLSLSHSGETDGWYNTAFGSDSLLSCTTGHSNNAFGSNALNCNTTGVQNTALSKNALFSNIDGAYNVAIGTATMYVSIGGDFNTACGFQALRYIEYGDNNVALGYKAGWGVSGGSFSNNILIGFQAGDSLSTGSDNIIIGYDQDASSATSSNELNIGGVVYGDLSNKKISINDNSPDSTLDININDAADIGVIIEAASGQTANLFEINSNGGSGGDYLGIDANGNVIKLKADPYENDDSNIFLGVDAGGAGNLNASGGSFGKYNEAYGNQSLYSIEQGYDNTAIGYQSLYSNTDGFNNVSIGYMNLYSNTTGFGNVSFGEKGLYKNTLGNYNIAAGYWSLYTNTEGDYNIGAGIYSLYHNSTGNCNTALGCYSLRENDTGDYNIGIGYESGYYNEIGDHNIYIGFRAGYGRTDESNSNNICIGNEAGGGIGDGANNNVFIGYNVGIDSTTGSNNIIIGYDINPSDTDASNELNIGGTVFGDLNNDYIGIGIFPTAQLHTTKGRIVGTTRITDSTATLDVDNHVIFVDTDNNDVLILLPPGVEGTSYRIINCGSSGNDITVVGDGSETIWGDSDITLADGDIIDLVYNTTEGWW